MLEAQEIHRCEYRPPLVVATLVAILFVIMSELGVIAAGSEQSADAGAEILRAGGNAIDAAAAGAFATAAGDAAITSLAGGGALVFRSADSGEVEVCDFFANAPGVGSLRREPGPAASTPPLDFYAVDIEFGVAEAIQKFHIGRGAAAVPGVIPGLVAALERWGTLSLAEVVAPAVRFLSSGIELTEYQASCIRVLGPILRLSPEGRRIFCDSEGELLRAGSVSRNLGLAETLERLGREGLDAVYHGDLASSMLKEFGPARGGWLTDRDLRGWKAEFRPALVTLYGGAQVATNPPPSAGGSFILLTLELFERVRLAEVPESSPERYRRLAAVFRAVSELRAEDPGIAERPDSRRLLAGRLDSILCGKAPSSGSEEPTGPGSTTHVSVIDREGNAAGVTLSHGEGCGHWIGRSGLHMNNILGEEDLFPGGFHRFEPGARLSSMMAPTVIAEPSGSVAVFGSGGSNRIRTVMVQVISALHDDGLDAEAAVRRGRIHVENGILSAETYALPGGEDILSEARKVAREASVFDAPSLFFGGVHLTRRDSDGRLSGAGDPRRGGVVRIVED